MLSIGADTILRHIPWVADMQRELSAIDKGASRRFDSGDYVRICPAEPPSGRRPDPAEAVDWARAYVKYGTALEWAASAVFDAPQQYSYDEDEARHTTIRLASEKTRKSRAAVCTDIAPAFETFIARRTPSAMAPSTTLATTSQQVQAMSQAIALGDGTFNTRAALVKADSVDEFLRLALAYAINGSSRAKYTEQEATTVWLHGGLGGPSWEDDYADSGAYRETVHRWLGRSRQSVLTAIQLATAGVSLSEVREYAASGISLEYVLALTEQSAAA
jgi:hypothetical protein